MLSLLFFFIILAIGLFCQKASFLAFWLRRKKHISFMFWNRISFLILFFSCILSFIFYFNIFYFIGIGLELGLGLGEKVNFYEKKKKIFFFHKDFFLSFIFLGFAFRDLILVILLLPMVVFPLLNPMLMLIL